MKERKTKQKNLCILDLTKIDGAGDFLCPRCGIKISPDDATEEIYSIVEAKVNSHGLEEVVISCNTCGSEIHVTGFSTLQELSDGEAKNCGSEEERICYINHM